MKTQILIRISALVLSIFMLSCQEEETTYTVKYEVITTAPGWYGEFINEKGERECKCAPPAYQSGWERTFKVQAPFTLHIDGFVDGFETGKPETPDLTTNIYVNGELVAGNTSNWTKGVASADYEIR